MPQYALRPSSPGELLDVSLGLARAHYLALLRLALVPYLLVILLAEYVATTDPMQPLALANFLFGSAVSAVVGARTSLAIWDVVDGRAFGATPFKPLLRRRGAAIILGYVLKWVFAFAGLLVLIVPGIYLMVLYFCVPAICAIEDIGFRGGRDRSRVLARPNLWRIFLTVGLFDLAMIVSALMFAGFFQGIAAVSPGSTATRWSVMLNWLLYLFVVPVRAALIATVYADCRIRSEGYDVEQTLAQPGAG